MEGKNEEGKSGQEWGGEGKWGKEEEGKERNREEEEEPVGTELRVA